MTNSADARGSYSCLDAQANSFANAHEGDRLEARTLARLG